jgi:hypothetical protein
MKPIVFRDDRNSRALAEAATKAAEATPTT